MAPPDRERGPATPLALRAAWSGLRRRAALEWRGTGLYALTLGGPKATGLVARPRELRPPREGLGAAVLAGAFPLAAAELDVGAGGDPWNRASPSRRLAVELHRFSWLSSLLAEGEAGAREGLRLTLIWRRLFDRPSAFAWGAEALERRVFNWACGLPALNDAASEAEGAMLAQSLARQARHLLRLDPSPARRAERLTAVAVAGAAIRGKAGAELLSAALRRLGPALDAAVLGDGGLRTRSPEQAMELQFDLMTLDDVLVQRGRETPEPVSRALDRLGGAVRFFAGRDGRLAPFQGGGPGERARVAAALAYDDAASQPYDHAPHSGYHRLEGAGLQVMIDAARPALDAWSEAACAQPLALTVTAGRARLITGGGWTPDAAAPQALRLAAAASTAVLGAGSPGKPLTGFAARALGPRLHGGPGEVSSHREEDGPGVWLELAHDGWVPATGFVHGRRLFLDGTAGELRGEDRFAPAEGVAAPRSTTYAVHFHLPPEVRATLARDGRSVLLRIASDRGWWLRNDAEEVALEPSVVIEHDAPVPTLQVVLRGEVASGGARVRWKLAPVPAPAPHSAPRSRA